MTITDQQFNNLRLKVLQLESDSKFQLINPLDIQSQNVLKIEIAKPAFTKGDLYFHDGNIRSKLGIGSDDEILVADSTTNIGAKWGSISIGSLSDTTITSPATGAMLVYSGGAWIDSQLPRIIETLDSSGVPVCRFDDAANGIRYIKISNAPATTGKALITGAGETNVAILLQGKGSGGVHIGDAEIIFPDTDGNNGEFLKTNGSGVLSFGESTGGGGSILSKSNTNVSLSDLNETTLMSFSLLANKIGTDGGVRIFIPLRSIEATNASTQIIRLKYGSTTIATLTLTGEFTDSGGLIEAYLFANGSASSQFGFITAGGARGNGAKASMGSIKGTGAEDSTGALTLSITAQRNSNNSLNDLKTFGYVAMLLTS